MLQAALNGARARAEHPAVPMATDELVHDAVACVAEGVGSVHLHPRDGDGRESLEPAVVDAVVAAVHAACGVPVGVSTGAWIEPDPARRAALAAGWSAPQFASVNLSEVGAIGVMEALLAAGVGIEAGVWSVADAERLGRSRLARRVTRVLVEGIHVAASDAGRFATEVHHALDRAGVKAPRLQHGEGEATWPLLADAVARGLDTRIGFEDTLHDPNGEPAPDNAALVRAARALGAG